MQLNSYYWINLRSILISQHLFNTLPYIKKTYYSFIIYFNFYKKFFIIFFIIFNLFSGFILKDCLVNKKKLANNPNNLLLIFTIHLKSFELFFNFIYYYLPNSLFSVKNITVYYKKKNKLALTNIQFKNFNNLTIFDYLNESLENIMNYFSLLQCLFKITYKLYSKNKFDLYLRLFFKIPVLKQYIL